MDPKQKGQIQVFLGIVLVVAALVFLGVRLFSNKTEEPPSAPEETVGEAGLPGDDSPIKSNIQPSGELPSGTKQTKLSVTTNEPGYCRYSLKAGQIYDSMTGRFSYDKAKILHTTNVSGLKDSQFYQYYVRCRDLAGNRNTEDAAIRFSIAGRSSSEAGSGIGGVQDGEAAPPLRSNLKPTSSLPSGTRKTEMSVTINKPGYCRYSTKSGQGYDSMNGRFAYDNDKLVHTANLSSLEDNKIYEFYVRCRDLTGNKNDDDAVIRFGVGGTIVPGGSASDTTPPSRFNQSPTSDLPMGTRKTIISLKTDEKAVCRYGTEAGLGYDAMRDVFDNTNSTTHSTEVVGLSEGQSYKYYVRCADQYNNKNTNDLIISFKVKFEDKTPPVMKNPSHVGSVLPAGTAEVVISISTDEQAACRYDSGGGLAYSAMKGKFTTYDQTKLFHTATIKSLQNGKSYDFFVRCQDLYGNANVWDVLISFRIMP